MNDDGRVDAVDAQLVLQYDAELVDTLANLPSGDANQNGRVNSVDAALILQLEAGLITQLPVPIPAGSRGRFDIRS